MPDVFSAVGAAGLDGYLRTASSSAAVVNDTEASPSSAALGRFCDEGN